MRVRFTGVVVALCALCALGAAPTTSAKAPKPPSPSFFGVDTWASPSANEFSRMRGGKVGTYRHFLYWHDVEPCRGCRDWTNFDSVVRDAARSHVRVLPFVYGSPSFLEPQDRYPPLGASALKEYSSFMKDLAARYGSNGRFWSENPELPKLPLAGIQVWNEPSHRFFWAGKKAKAADYVKLLKAAANAIRSADRKTKVVLAGIPNVGGAPLVNYVKQLYNVPGFRKAFDVMAFHPYAVDARAVFETLAKIRSIMTHHGDGGKQTWITETGWASVPAKSFSAGSPKGQASILSEVYKGLIKRRKSSKLGMVVWFVWRDRGLAKGEKNGWASHTGLFQIKGKPKPAWKALVKITGGQAGSGSL